MIAVAGAIVVLAATVTIAATIKQQQH
jgi:hypothetical protein